MKTTGIWIDRKRAWIMTIDGAEEKFNTVESEIEDYHPAGGYGGKVPYGPQIANPEDKIQNRQDAQLKDFFQDVLKATGTQNRILIEGPADTKVHLSKFIDNEHNFRDCEVVTRDSDKKTENQFKAGIREYFEKPA